MLAGILPDYGVARMIETSCPDRPRLPVGKVLCVGRNWAAHAAEMSAPRPQQPIWFVVPPTALCFAEARGAPRRWTLPTFSNEIHHEVEMVVRLGGGGRDISLDDASALVDAAAVGLDLTARDLQSAAKKAGLPWSVAKGFDDSSPLGDLAPVASAAELAARRLRLRLGDRLVQDSSTDQMLFPVPELLADASRYFRLEPGDLIFTGTPPGVGPLEAGDHLEAELEGCPPLRLEVHGAEPD